MSRRFLIKEVPVLIYTLKYTNHLIDMMNLDDALVRYDS